MTSDHASKIQQCCYKLSYKATNVDQKVNTKLKYSEVQVDEEDWSVINHKMPYFNRAEDDMLEF